MAGIAITPNGFDCRGVARGLLQSTSIPVARRMLALALVLEGADRTSAARSCGMDRQTLRDWVLNRPGFPGGSNF